MSTAADTDLVAAELRARRDAARGPVEAAVWALVAGEPEAGLARIREFIGSGVDRGKARWRAPLAALVDDDGAARSDAAAALATASTYVPGWRDWVGAMLSLFAGDDAGAARHVAALDPVASTRDKLRSGHPSAIAAIPRGLLRGDAAEAGRGLDALLAWHLRRTRSPSDVFNSYLGVINLDAISALLLAHRRGLAIPVAPKYRAATIPLHVLYLTEWSGAPLPRYLRFEVTSDLLAGPWLGGRGLDMP